MTEPPADPCRIWILGYSDVGGIWRTCFEWIPALGLWLNQTNHELYTDHYLMYWYVDCTWMDYIPEPRTLKPKKTLEGARKVRAFRQMLLEGTLTK